MGAPAIARPYLSSAHLPHASTLPARQHAPPRARRRVTSLPTCNNLSVLIVACLQQKWAGTGGTTSRRGVGRAPARASPSSLAFLAHTRPNTTAGALRGGTGAATEGRQSWRVGRAGRGQEQADAVTNRRAATPVQADSQAASPGGACRPPATIIPPLVRLPARLAPAPPLLAIFHPTPLSPQHRARETTRHYTRAPNTTAPWHGT